MSEDRKRFFTHSPTTHSLIPLLALCLLLGGCTRAGIARMRDVQLKAGTATPVSIASSLKTVPVGEELEYDIFWLGVLVGSAKLTTSLTPDKKLILLNFQAQSNWYLKILYPIRVRLSSWVDSETVSPRRFESYLKRQWRVHESVITFDLTSGTSLQKLLGDREVMVPITPKTQDGLSMLYYARTMPFELGKTIPLEVTADGRNWPLNGTVMQAGIIRIGNSGYWPAVEGQVELAYPVPFFHGATARVWFSADEDRIPLLAKIRSRIGPVSVVLARRSLEVKNSR